MASVPHRRRAAELHEVIAKQTIELAKSGERNPDLLCEVALKEFRLRPL
jgi:hypothetical protein